MQNIKYNESIDLIQTSVFVFYRRLIECHDSVLSTYQWVYSL